MKKTLTPSLILILLLICSIAAFTGCNNSSKKSPEEYRGSWYRILNYTERTTVLTIREKDISYIEPETGNAVDDWDTSGDFKYNEDSKTFEMKNGHKLTIISMENHQLQVEIDDGELTFYDTEDLAYEKWVEYQQSDEATADLTLSNITWVTGKGDSQKTLIFYDDIFTYVDKENEPVNGFLTHNNFKYDGKTKTYTSGKHTLVITDRTSKVDGNVLNRTLTLQIDGEELTFHNSENV